MGAENFGTPIVLAEELLTSKVSIQKSLQENVARPSQAGVNLSHAPKVGDRRIALNSAIGLAVTNTQGHFVHVNQAFCCLTGYNEGELRSLDCVSITHPDDREKNFALARRIYAGEIENFLLEARYITKQGSTVWVRNSVDVVRNKSGQPVNFIALAENITEVKEAEARLQESESRFRDIYQHARVGIAEIGADGRFLMVNPVLCRMLGYSESELVKKTFAEVTHPEDRALETALLEPMQSGQSDSYEIEKRYLHRNGSVVWAIVTSSAFKTTERLSYCISISQDITERKRLELEKLLLLDQERLAKANAESAKTELLETLERISDGFFVLDRDWRYRYINEQGARYLGRRPEDLIGKNIWTEFPESVGQATYDLYHKALEEQVTTCEEVYFAQWNRWFDVRIYPSADGLSIMFHDTTERRQSQQELRNTLEQLRSLSARLQTAREEERQQVARDLHDQIGQILTAVKMDVEWVARHLPQDQARVRARLESTLNLVLHSIESVRRICTELRPGVLDDLGLGAAIEWQANEFASRTSIQCEVSVPTEDLGLDANRSTAIFRILQEALTNVARHAEAKVVRVSLAHRNGKVLLVVQDDGKGILDSDLAASKGSLGLLGMKERAQACGGELHIWGEPGRGTTVVVDISLSASEQKDSNDAHFVSR